MNELPPSKRKNENLLENLSEHDKRLIPGFLMKVLNMTSLEELENFKERIKKAHGVVRIFVHPMYREGKDKRLFLDEDIAFDSYQQIKKGMHRHIKSKGLAPLIFFEEEGRNRLELRGQVVIPTEKGNGSISQNYLIEIFRDFNLSFDELQIAKQKKAEFERKLSAEIRKDEEFVEHIKNNNKDFGKFDISRLVETYNSVIDIHQKKLLEDSVVNHVDFKKYFYSIVFNSLGIKKVVAGGMYFEKGHSGDYSGCLGRIVSELEAVGIKVAMSRYHMDGDGLNYRRNEV